MKKIVLDVEALAVDSFVAEAEPGGKRGFSFLNGTTRTGPRGYVDTNHRPELHLGYAFFERSAIDRPSSGVL